MGKRQQETVKGRVSVVTPVYNGETYLSPMLDSVLEQTYPHIEMILVDDGSTDRTIEVAEEYRKKFEDKGYRYQVVKAKHKCAAAAINQGLPFVTGEYLIWPDSDDRLEPESVEKRVKFLESHPKYQCVRTLSYYFDQKTGEVARADEKTGDLDKEDLFWDILESKTFVCCGCYMLRTAPFFEIYPNCHIPVYEYNVGQNFQMLLPFMYRHKCPTIKERLYGVCVREGSHSRKKLTQKEEERKYRDYEKLIDEIAGICGIKDEASKKRIEYWKAKRSYGIALKYGSKRRIVTSLYRLYQCGEVHADRVMQEAFWIYIGKNKCYQYLRKHVTRKDIIIILVIFFGLVLPPPAYNPPVAEEVTAQNDDDKADEANKVSEADKEAEVNNIIKHTLPGIVCWGDSLTSGYGGDETTFPNVISRLVKQNVIDTFDVPYTLESPRVENLGVFQEDSATIAGRAGGVPYVTAEDIVIPEGTKTIELPIVSEDGKKVEPRGPGYSGLDDITIAGITGNISMEIDKSAEERTYYFTRKEEGEEVRVPAGTEILTYGSMHYLTYFPVVFIGENDDPLDIKELVKYQKAIVGHYEDNKDNYIIVGLSSGTAKERARLEAVMTEEYGDKYINLREYMSTSGIEDANRLLNAGIKPTKHDKEMMKEGRVPESLMIEDEVHFNAYGYELIGRLIYDRMEQLGYFNKVRTAVTEFVNENLGEGDS